MKLDEFGFPRPADFDERPARLPRSGGVTGRRVGLLVGAVLIALAGAAIVEFGPEIEAKLARAFNLKDRGLEAMQQAMMQAVRERRFGDAAAICGRLVKMQPRNVRLQLLQAQLFLQAGQERKAIGVCEELFSKNPDNAQPLLLKASIQAKIGDYKEAVKTSDAVLKLDPDDPTALNNRAYFRALARVDLKEALADVQEALKAEPDNETFIDTRAYLYYLFGRFDEALTDYNRILRDGGRRMQLEDVGEIYFHRGLLYKHMGDERRMKEDYDRARRSGFKITEEPPPLVEKGVKKGVISAFGVDDPAPSAAANAAVAIGNFDGVHLGHHRLLAVLRAEARRLGVPSVALCLYPHPLSLLRPESAPTTLLWPERRARLLRESGADEVVFLETAQVLLELSPERFFDEILVAKLQIRALVEGENFRFGRGRAGDVTLLKRLCRSAGISMTSVSLADDDDSAVSSTRIREAAARGDLEEVAALSGRRHRIRGIVGVGAQRGRTVGFPTANLEDVQGLTPAPGVYATVAHFDDGRRFTGACNIGPNPTFGENATKIEVHLLDFAEDVYGRPLEVEFVRRLRDVKKFAGVDELLRQIRQDVDRTREAINAMPPEPTQPELAFTIAEWVRWDSSAALTPVGISLKGAAFAEPGVVRLDWRCGGAPTPHVAMDLLFGIEERLRRAFPKSIT